MTPKRFAQASVLAPAVGLAPLMALSVAGFDAPEVLVTGRVDEVLKDAIVGVLVGFPLIYVLFSLATFSAGKLLWRLGCHSSLRRFLSGSLLLAVLASMPVALSVGHWADYRGQQMAFAMLVYAISFSMATLPAAVSWWHLTRTAHAFASCRTTGSSP